MNTIAIHTGLLPESDPTVEDIRKALAKFDLDEVINMGDSFLQWGEEVADEEWALEAFGTTDRRHLVIYVSDVADPIAFGTTCYSLLVDAGIADPTANCNPSAGHVPFAVTDSVDWAESPSAN